jgi:hypothetical protein
MKKDNMLNESTIRRFMKLATIDGLSDKFVAENLDEANEEELEERGGPKPSMKRDEDEMREGEEEELDEMRGDKDKEEMDEAAEEEVDEGMRGDDEEMDEVALEEEEVEMDMELGAEEPAAEASGMVSVDQLMSALERALEDVLGQEVEVSQDGEEEMDMGAEEPADLDMDMAPAAEEADEEDDLEETTIQPDVVEEVFARVIQRLTQETKSNKE